MSGGFVRIYQTGWSPDRAAARISSLARSGITLVHPVLGQVRGWDAERDEPVSFAEDDVRRWLELVHRDCVDFQFWFDADHDLGYRAERLRPDVVVEEFVLDGTDRAEVVRLMHAEVERLGSDVVGFVVDQWGDSLEFDLDDAVLTGGTPVSVAPDLLLVRPEVAEALNAKAAGTPGAGILPAWRRDTTG